MTKILSIEHSDNFSNHERLSISVDTQFTLIGDSVCGYQINIDLPSNYESYRILFLLKEN